MKYMHLYHEDSDFQNDYDGENYLEPWASYTIETEEVHYNKPDPFNGHDYVDLGLPSGALWATCNAGASSPEEYGAYYAWGEVNEKSDFSTTKVVGGPTIWNNYKWGSAGAATAMTKYNQSDGLLHLESEDDAVSVNMGGSWVLPTVDDYQELISGTNQEWTMLNGVSGCLFTSKTNSETMFVPCGGYKLSGTNYTPDDEEAPGNWTNLWTRDVIAEDNQYNGAYAFNCGPMGASPMWVEVNGWYSRCDGIPVRGIIIP